MKQKIWGCSGISWTICKQSAPRSKQTTTPTNNHTKTSSLNLHRPDAFPDAQPTASKHWRHKSLNWTKLSRLELLKKSFSNDYLLLQYNVLLSSNFSRHWMAYNIQFKKLQTLTYIPDIHFLPVFTRELLLFISITDIATRDAARDNGMRWRLQRQREKQVGQTESIICWYGWL